MDLNPNAAAGTDRWHRLGGDEVAARLAVEVDAGLSTDEVTARRRTYGANRLPLGQRRSKLSVFVDQFRSFLVAVLVGAAVLAAAVGDLKDLIVISVVVVFNAVLGFAQEYRAESSLAALERMLVTRARIRRDGTIAEVVAEDLVPGDVVLVEAGDRVPADGRWVVAVELEVDESAFTGESMPVSKTTQAVLDEDLALADQRSMGFMNTVVTRGRGEFVVTATGASTEVGRLAGMLRAAESPPTPLQREIGHLGRRLTLVAAAAVALVVVLDLFRDVATKDMLLNAVALAVAAIPEGLPAVLTVTLAVGTSQLARRHAIVKRLASVETLGATTVICSDKTGTLTVNQMTAREVYAGGSPFTVTGEGYSTIGEISPGAAALVDHLDRLLLGCALCNDAVVRDGTIVGDPTEAALVVLAAKGGVDVVAERARRLRLAEVSFDSAAKFMATFHADGDEMVQLYVKGAPDVLLAMCSTVATGGTEEPLDAVGFDTLNRAIDSLASRGLRVLGVASRTLDRGGWDATVDQRRGVRDLRFEGLIGLADPPRPEARDAIARCHRAGIAVKMITGDHAVTARSIANELGLTGEVITGHQLDQLDIDDLAARIDGIAVFARVAPEHKVAIVRALQERNHVVAMTGDGVNDAPALKRADIGIAMGITGTEVAKEAATMVLTDDNFATIVDAVEGGRTIYDNIIKFVTFQLSTNIGAILTIVAASLLAWPGDGHVLFAPLAILWVNIIMDGPPAMALGVDPAGPGTMSRPPRSPDSRILTLRRLRRLVGYGTLMAAGTLAAYRITAGTGEVSDADATRGAAVALTAFVFFQLFNLQNARFPDHSVLRRHLFTNWRLWAAATSVILLQAVAMTWDPMQRLFTGRDTAVDLTGQDWAIAAAAALPILVVDEARKAIRAARSRDA